MTEIYLNRLDNSEGIYKELASKLGAEGITDKE